MSIFSAVTSFCRTPEISQRHVGIPLLFYDLLLLFYLSWQVADKVPLYGYSSWALLYIIFSAGQLLLLTRNLVTFLWQTRVWNISWVRNTTLIILALRMVPLVVGFVEKSQRTFGFILTVHCFGLAALALGAITVLWAKLAKQRKKQEKDTILNLKKLKKAEKESQPQPPIKVLIRRSLSKDDAVSAKKTQSLIVVEGERLKVVEIQTASSEEILESESCENLDFSEEPPKS